jgi:NitT/TauT family transport system permease protein
MKRFSKSKVSIVSLSWLGNLGADPKVSSWALNVLLAVYCLHVMDRSVMLWAIVSQTIPILALAPMVIAVMGSMGFRLHFLAVDCAHLSSSSVDRRGCVVHQACSWISLVTYNASSNQGFWPHAFQRLRLYLFASPKIGVSALV